MRLFKYSILKHFILLIAGVFLLGLVTGLTIIEDKSIASERIGIHGMVLNNYPPYLPASKVLVSLFHKETEKVDYTYTDVRGHFNLNCYPGKHSLKMSKGYQSSVSTSLTVEKCPHDLGNIKLIFVDPQKKTEK